MGPRMREDNGWGRLFVGNATEGDHPHPPWGWGGAGSLTFPYSRGQRDREAR